MYVRYFWQGITNYAVNLANPVHIPRGVTCKCVTAMVPSDSYHSHHQCWKRSDLTHDLIYVPMPSLARRMISLATTASSLVRVDTTSYTDLCTQAETDNMHTHSPAQPLLPATRASEWTPPPVQIHALTPTPYTCTHTHTHQLGHCCLQLLRQSGHRLLYKFTHSRQHHTHAHTHSPAQPLLPATRASEWTPPPVQIHALTPTPYTCTQTHTHSPAWPLLPAAPPSEWTPPPGCTPAPQ